MSRRRAVTTIVCVFAVSIGIIVFLSTVNYNSQVSVGGKVFLVDVAETKYLQERGFSGHAPITDNEGMFFIFKEPDNYGFWMKDMLFPIDILWMDADLKIIHIEKNVKPDSYPKVFYPEAPALYVLEISAGEAQKLQIKIGDTVKIVKKYF